MEKNDKVFFLALAYTTATEKDLNPNDFLAKVEDNQKIFEKLPVDKKTPIKARIRNKAKLGI